MPIATRCRSHRQNFRAACAECCRVVAAATKQRKRRLELKTAERLARVARQRERDEKRAYRAILGSLQSRARRLRMRWVRNADGLLCCPLHGALAPRKRRGKDSHYCRACSRESARRTYAERTRIKKHDAKLGTFHVIRSPLAQLIKTGLAPDAPNRKRS